MNINDFMSKKVWKRLEHNQPFQATLQQTRQQTTKNGFMVSFDFKFIDSERIESQNCHFSQKTLINEDGTQKTTENDQITPFIKRLLQELPENFQNEVNGASAQELIDAIIASEHQFTLYPIFSTYEYNGQMRNQRDLWLSPKAESAEEGDDDEIEF